MKVLRYDKRRNAAEIEYEGKIRLISSEAAMKMRVNLGKDIPEEVLPELLTESEEILCRQYLYDYASKYSKTKRGYFEKLLEKGYSKSAAQKAVERAENYGYINDLLFAQKYVESNSSKKGRFALKNELRKKGVSSAIIDEVLHDLGDQDEELLALAEKLAKKPLNTREERAKLARKLIARGFEYDAVNRVLSVLSSSDLDD